MMDTEQPRPGLSVEARQEMEIYGIVRVPADSFRYREFRYTNLRDALAQARRDADRKQPNRDQTRLRHG